MELAYTEHLRGSMSSTDRARALQLRAGAQGAVYAALLDLTKMLSSSPGTQRLDGVRDFQHNFFMRSA